MPTTKPVVYCAREGCYHHARLLVTTTPTPAEQTTAEVLCERHALREVAALSWSPDTVITLRAMRSAS